MSTRLLVRLHVLCAAVWHKLNSAGRRRRPDAVRRILVTHHPQMIGDTLLLTPLLAKLRERYPAAEIVLTASPLTAPLYERHPYGVVAVPYAPNRHRTLRALSRLGGFDLALAPGDNRYGWLAMALGARWIVGFAGDRPAWKNWMFDELQPYPATPATWGEMAAALIAGPPARVYEARDWPAPACASFERPPAPYCVLHVGASTPLKHWPAERWRALAAHLAARGLHVVWSAGPNEQRRVDEIDPERRYANYAGKLNLAQLWHLLADAALLVCPDTGAAHLGRLVGTPTIVLFGPGSAVVCGAGAFWAHSPFKALADADFPCRDRRNLFGRRIEWLRRCGRPAAQCPTPGACMAAIGVDAVVDAIDELDVMARAHRSPDPAGRACA